MKKSNKVVIGVIVLAVLVVLGVLFSKPKKVDLVAEKNNLVKQINECFTEPDTVTIKKGEDFDLNSLIKENNFDVKWDKEYAGAGSYMVTITGHTSNGMEISYRETYTIIEAE